MLALGEEQSPELQHTRLGLCHNGQPLAAAFQREVGDTGLRGRVQAQVVDPIRVDREPQLGEFLIRGDDPEIDGPLAVEFVGPQGVGDDLGLAGLHRVGQEHVGLLREGNAQSVGSQVVGVEVREGVRIVVHSGGLAGRIVAAGVFDAAELAEGGRSLRLIPERRGTVGKRT